MTVEEFMMRFQHAKNILPEPDFPLRAPGRPAAVLVPLIDHGANLSVLFTQRAKHLKHHPGQVSFPGGKFEPQDNNLLATALRETMEETGISADKITVVGTLPPFRTISQYEVTPFVGVVAPDFELNLDENEVEAVFEVPLAYLMDQNNHLIHWVHRKHKQHPIYFITWEGKTIWGATAAFVRALSNHL